MRQRTVGSSNDEQGREPAHHSDRGVEQTPQRQHHPGATRGLVLRTRPGSIPRPAAEGFLDLAPGPPMPPRRQSQDDGDYRGANRRMLWAFGWRVFVAWPERIVRRV